METNVYEAKGNIVIAGACLKTVCPEGYEKAAAGFDEVYTLCLEETHINMAVTKISAILGTGQVKRIRFATVDRSPHCVQMHYIRHEVERTCPEHIPMESVVIAGGQVIPISQKTVELSKSLAQLEKLAGESRQPGRAGRRVGHPKQSGCGKKEQP